MSPNRTAFVLLVAFALVCFTWAPDASAKKGTGKPQPEPDPAVPFTVIDSGQFSGIGTARNATVTNQADWNALWADHAGGTPPSVDFSRHIVVSVFLGQRASTAYSVHIDRIVKSYLLASYQDGTDPLFTYHIDYVEEEKQGRHCAFSEIVTTPFVIAVVARPELIDILPEGAMPTYGGTKQIVDCKGGRGHHTH